MVYVAIKEDPNGEINESETIPFYMLARMIHGLQIVDAHIT